MVENNVWKKYSWPKSYIYIKNKCSKQKFSAVSINKSVQKDFKANKLIIVLLSYKESL